MDFIEERKTKLSDVISKSFYDIHKDILKCNHTHYWLKGGRGSTKSSFISIEIIFGMMTDKNANAVALRKVGVNIKDSIFEQLRWAIDILGVSEKWEIKVSVPEIILKDTGQKIIFRGGDNPKKIKSTKFLKGYPKFIWYEEVDEFLGIDEIRNINQSLMRGGEKFIVFYSYNPPKNQRCWINNEIIEKRDDKIVHHSTYIDVPKNWLGKQFFAEAEHIKNTKPDVYEHEYLGKVTGTGGEVFNNISIREICDDEIKNFDRIHRGLDWGYACDPLHYTVNHYDRMRKRLYIFYEIHKSGLTNIQAAKLINNENIGKKSVVCDSAEPKSIDEIREFGVRAEAAKKGPDSVEFGIKWLQSLDEIIIDPVRCPFTAKEFLGYEFEKDNFGGFKAKYPDYDNHSIDAVRYSLESEMRKVTVR